MESILTSVKQSLGIAEDDTTFDKELIFHINGALMIAGQLGVGDVNGFKITGTTETWTDFIGKRIDLELIKQAVTMRVQLIFDPPQNSFLVEAIKDQIQEFEWRVEFNKETAKLEGRD